MQTPTCAPVNASARHFVHRSTAACSSAVFGGPTCMGNLSRAHAKTFLIIVLILSTLDCWYSGPTLEVNLMASVYIAHSTGGSLDLKSPYCTTNTTTYPDHWRDSAYAETRGNLGTVTSGYVINNPPGDDASKFNVRPSLRVSYGR